MDEDSELADDQSPDELFRTAVVFESALGFLALFLGWILGPDAREMIPMLDGEGLPEIGKGIAWGCLGAIPMLLLIEGVQRIDCEPVRELHRLGEDGIIRSLVRLNVGELILISVCAGVGEELLFRGWFFEFMRGLFPEDVAGVIPVVTALVVSSVLFGLVHPITKLYVVLATVIGLYLGILMVGTGNLIIPITAHAVYDAVQMIRAKYRPLETA